MAQKPTLRTRAQKERIIPIQIEGTMDLSQSSEDDENVHVEIDSNENEEIETIEEDDEEPERILPMQNVPEKIIIVFDRAQDENFTNFVLNNGSTYSPINMLKRGTEMFLRNKSAINNNHQYALIVLNQCTAAWQRGFTTKVNEIIQSLNQITECEAEDVFDLNLLFEVISENVKLPYTEDLSVPPPYIVHVILLYGRSYTIPQMTETSTLLNSPHFFFDILMTHEPLNTTNNCSRIFSTLQNIDKKGYSYFFPVARNASELHVSMAKLLSHPLQRPTQKQAKYTLEDAKK